MTKYVLVDAEDNDSCSGCCFSKGLWGESICSVEDDDEFDCSSGGIYKELKPDTWSLAQQQDEAYAEAEFDEFFNKQGWYCTLGSFPAIVGVGETKKQAFNQAWGKKMGKVKALVTEEMENTGMDIDEVLERRGNRYGAYRHVAATAQEIKSLFRDGRFSWPEMETHMQESLDMIANKLARILNGDPYYDDSWRDIAGYATLVVKELEKGK